jgi:hypothetical protein
MNVTFTGSEKVTAMLEPVSGMSVAPSVGTVETTVGAASAAMIVHVNVVGVPTFPALSVARTWKVCDPSPRPEKVAGLAHGAKPAASRRHSMELIPVFTSLADPVVGSVAVKLKLAPVLVVGLTGVELRATVGEVVSMRYVSRFDASDRLPSESWAAPLAIWKVRFPSLFGAVRLTVKKNGPVPDPVPMLGSQSIDDGDVPPMIRSAVWGSNPVTGLLNVRVQEIAVALVGIPFGVQDRVAAGRAVSIVRETVEDAVEPLPAASATAPAAICRDSVPSVAGAPRVTLNAYGPAPAPVAVPALQAADVPPIVKSLVVGLKPEADSLNVTEQLRLVALVDGPAGLHVNDVTDGAVRSIVHVDVAAAPTFPALSTARTWNVWLPAANAMYAAGLVQAAKPLPSSWHSRRAIPDVTPSTVGSAGVVKLNDADWRFVELAGLPVMDGAGGAAVSIV